MTLILSMTLELWVV